MADQPKTTTDEKPRSSGSHPVSRGIRPLAPAVLAVATLAVSEACGGQETEKRIDLGVETGSAVAESQDAEAASPADAQGEEDAVADEAGPREGAASEEDPKPR